MKQCNITLLLASAALTFPLNAFAQDKQDGGDHHDDGAEIVVTAVYARGQDELLAGTSVLRADELTRDLRPSIGETLSRQPGVSATSFGPNASRPVLRGFQGERVRVLIDGVGSFDVSNTSVDHAVAINPLTADRIEVLRGPSSLLFGSSAIGGVVNVIDSRIPRRVPDEALHLDLTGTYGSASNERSAGGRVDVKLSPQLVAHVDGNWTKTGNLRTGGFILAPELRADALASGDAEVAQNAGLKGKLPNTAGENWEVAGGLAWVGDTANFGFAVTRYENLYGVPVRLSTAAIPVGEEGPEAVRLDARQTRYDLRGEFTLAEGFLETVKLRGGHANYRHDELEETGAIGTSFFAKGSEARLELVQRERGGWKGAFGAQFVARRLNIVGEEKFLPQSKASQFGIFTVQTIETGKSRIEAGARVEQSRANARADDQLGTAASRRRFTTFSGSLGASHAIGDGWRIGLNASHSERAPSVEELFPNGPHAGTQSFEIGNPSFAKERANGVELTVNGTAGPIRVSAALFHNWFSNFIYELPTGAEQDGLPVFQFRQDKARYLGGELELEAKLGNVGDFALAAHGVADFTRATIVRPGGKLPAPRIPSARFLAGLSAEGSHFGFGADVERVTGQDRIAILETSTPGFTLVNLSATIRPMGQAGPLSFLISANNLFDVVARRHASALKDYAPLSGRDVRITAKLSL
jgi:iron complex outermembrane recepter protein